MSVSVLCKTEQQKADKDKQPAPAHPQVQSLIHSLNRTIAIHLFLHTTYTHILYIYEYTYANTKA